MLQVWGRLKGELLALALNRAMAVVACALFPAVLQAQTWPAKPVRLVVPFPAAGSTDVVGRLIAQELSQRLGQPIVVENRPGVTGAIGSELVARTAPDGYNLLMSNVGSQGVIQALLSNVKYDTMADFTHIGMIGTFANVLLVNTGVPARTLAELVALAKKSPGKMSYATSGNGSVNHFTGELLKHYAGINIVHVPYKGAGPALNDLIGRQVEIMSDGIPSSAAHIKAGTVRALAVTSPERLPAFPDVPTFRESGYEEMVNAAWFGLSSAANTPAPIVERINTELRAVLTRREVAARLEGIGLVAQAMTPEQFTSYVAKDVAMWRDAAKKTGVKAD